MRRDVLSLALVSLLGVAKALPIGTRVEARSEAAAVPSTMDLESAKADSRLLARAAGKPGIAYAPYHDDNRCKSAAEVLLDFKLLQKDYSHVRLYGVDCGMVKNAVAAAKETGLRLFLGIYDFGNVPGQIQQMNTQLGGDWSLVDMVSSGNELMGKGRTVDEVLNQLKETRAALSTTPFRGKVVAVESWDKVEANPTLCQGMDICVVNMHPFFDQSATAGGAGKFLDTSMGKLRNGTHVEHIVIAETGWPTQGQAHDRAVPGLAEQANAIKSIKETFANNPEDLYLFSAFNDKWKKDGKGTFEAEKFYGIDGKDSPTH